MLFPEFICKMGISFFLIHFFPGDKICTFTVSGHVSDI